MERDPGHSKAMADAFDYYMVRVQRSAGDPGLVAGQVERLGTGEKHGFRTGDQLVRLVAQWPAAGSGPHIEDSAIHVVTGREP